MAKISTTDYTSVLQNQNYLRLKVANIRGTIFDCNMNRLTNNQKRIYAAVSPTPRAITAISSHLKDDELLSVLEKLRSGKPVLCEVSEIIECDGIICTEVYTTNSKDNTAIHTVGYTDSQGHGVTGLEKAYDDLLFSGEDVDVLYECDGKGNILGGSVPTLKTNSGAFSNGVVSTIDINIQTIAERAAEDLELGAVVIAEAKTSKIRALVSKPTFSAENLAETLKNADSPLLNRAINAYNVGSVFKPCVAATGIDMGLGNFGYTCTGSCEIIDRYFKCHNLSGHSSLNLKSAIANSCNTFFYNYAFKIGGEQILKTASNFKFGQKINLCEGISCASGNLPEKNTLSNIANLANLSIGQGELLLSPVSMLTLYSAVANGGSYYMPSLVEGTLQNGSFTPHTVGNPTRAMKKDTAEKLKDYLSAVLIEGTAKGFAPTLTTAAGKTATAQTGKFKNGAEICQGWFCGFFPLESPEYVVIVFSEDTARQSKSCVEIFSQIADNISKKGGF